MHDRNDITLTNAEMERLNIVMMAEKSVNLGLHEDVGDYGCQMVCGDLFIFEERIGLSNDLHHFLELL